MTDAKFNLAAAYKEEIRQIDILLAPDPIKAPYDLASSFPKDLNYCVDLATPALTSANEDWEDVLTTRRGVVVGLFAALTAE